MCILPTLQHTKKGKVLVTQKYSLQMFKACLSLILLCECEEPALLYTNVLKISRLGRAASPPGCSHTQPGTLTTRQLCPQADWLRTSCHTRTGTIHWEQGRAGPEELRGSSEVYRTPWIATWPSTQALELHLVLSWPCCWLAVGPSGSHCII